MANYRFDPPVYIQRYGLVSDLLNDSRFKDQITKVVDFGCSELKFFKYLKHLDTITDVLEVDRDEPTLKQFSRLVEPVVADYICQREIPLNVSVLCGSACDPDYRLVGCDAVVCIELIEHMDPGALDRLPHNIFGFIEPLLVFITTPNADFNVFFPDMPYGNFRHWDHRFEWTREQFQNWASNIIQRYPNYTVEFRDIGYGPKDTKELGGCSQMAFFVHKNYQKKADMSLGCASSQQINLNNHTINGNNSGENVELLNSENLWDNVNWNDFQRSSIFYSTVAEYNYPYIPDFRTTNEKIVDEAISRICLFTHYDNECYNEEKFRWEIPIDRLSNPVFFETDPPKPDEDLLCMLLRLKGYEIENKHLIHNDEDRFSDLDSVRGIEEFDNLSLNDNMDLS